MSNVGFHLVNVFLMTVLAGAPAFDCPPDSAYFPDLDTTSASFGNTVATGLCACLDFGSTLAGTDSTVTLTILLTDNEPLRAFQFEIADNTGDALKARSAKAGNKIEGWTVPIVETYHGTSLILGFSLSGEKTQPGVGDTLVQITFSIVKPLAEMLSFYFDSFGGVRLSDVDAQNVACSFPDSANPVSYPAGWPVALEGGSGAPDSFRLRDSFPNPFNTMTTIQFDLPSEVSVAISIYNILGQRVVTLVNRTLSAGSHTVKWRGQNRLGVDVASGLYVYTLTTDDFFDQKKMVLLR
ncbi:MAG: T9SS type A sorting domain-containing protein [Candidatus Neomarinimicrobiota bacterium]